VPISEFLTVFTVNFREAVEPEPISENTMNPGNTPPFERVAVFVITIAGLTGLA
jgi:hypothetical protein